MEFKEMQEAVTINEVAFDGCSEQPVDLDFTLPDYCPDISRILKCQVNPRVTGYQFNSDSLTVEGITAIRLLYVGEGSGCVRSYNHSLPFTANFAIKKMADNPVVRTKIKVDYMNCRAISQRRVDLHGAFSVCAKVYVKKREQLIVGAQGAGIQLKKTQSTVSSIIGSVDRSFNVTEMLHIGQNNAPVEQVISHNAVAVMNEFKAIPNKVLAKGELLIKVLYASDLAEGLMDITEHSVPISQIIDIEGVDEDSMCDVRFEVINADVTPRLDSNGDYRMLSVDVRINAYARAFKEMDISILSDAYSTDCELIMEQKPVKLEKVAAMVKDTFLSRQTFDMPEDGVERVIDLWCEAEVTNFKEEDNGYRIDGNLDICMLACDIQGTASYYERKSEFEYMCEIRNMPQNSRCEADMTVVAVSFSLTAANTIEVRCEMKVDAMIYSVSNEHTICSLQPDESKPYKKDDVAALTIYYADEGENIWDIAKKYKTSVEAVSKENNLDDEVLRGKEMLLIPIC